MYFVILINFYFDYHNLPEKSLYSFAEFVKVVYLLLFF